MTSHSRAICSQSQKIVKFMKIMAQTMNFESRCELTDVQASMYDRKTTARPFGTFHDILRSLSLTQSYLEGRNAPTWRQRESPHMRLSGIDGLSRIFCDLHVIPHHHYPANLGPVVQGLDAFFGGRGVD